MDQKKEYVLQWAGHATNITERFSGLFARQTLVDITLICQEQKLRVHKLVLASCSLYFEEMLEQDLGQEPIILLKDLDFDILKAMVEFMYCGETTIAHCHLQSLLDAAQVFKVKDLESIVCGTMQSKNYTNNQALDKDLEIYNSQAKSSSKEKSLDILFDDLGPKYKNLSDTIDENEDISCHNDSTNAFTVNTTETNDWRRLTEDLIGEGTLEDSKAIFDAYYNERHRKDNSVDEKAESENTQSDLFDGFTRVGECSRVYTHKRKSIDEKRTLKSNTLPALDTDCIDLLEVPCDTPVTLPSAIDMETSDFIWSLSTEGISNVNQENSSNDRRRNVYQNDGKRSGKPNQKSMRHIKGLFSMSNGNISMSRPPPFQKGLPPVLRRSVRLNQLENDDSMNNNSEMSSNKSRYRQEEVTKVFNSNLRSLSKSNGKLKELEARGADENRVVSKKNVNKRNAAKLSSKSGGSSSLSKMPKDGKKSKAIKLKNGKLEKESLECDLYAPHKLNTIASVDRALWGDMSDVLESHENGAALPEYSSCKEIPFAVGLLPLHAALERMQAMPDYQPRKTRSSFATPVKQESNGIKRRANTDGDSPGSIKKPCSLDLIDHNCSTLCHIKIHTSSQCSQSRNVTDQLVGVDSATDER